MRDRALRAAHARSRHPVVGGARDPRARPAGAAPAADGAAVRARAAARACSRRPRSPRRSPRCPTRAFGDWARSLTLPLERSFPTRGERRVPSRGPRGVRRRARARAQARVRDGVRDVPLLRADAGGDVPLQQARSEASSTSRPTRSSISTMEDVWVWDKNRPSRIIPRAEVHTTSDVTVEELKPPTTDADDAPARVQRTARSLIRVTRCCSPSTSATRRRSSACIDGARARRALAPDDRRAPHRRTSSTSSWRRCWRGAALADVVTASALSTTVPTLTHPWTSVLRAHRRAPSRS